MREKILMLYSGGADSRLMLEFARYLQKDVYCLLINYNQLHIDELTFAKEHLETNHIEYQIVEIKNLNIESGLTSGNKNKTDNVHPMHVPGRNTLFLSIASSIAESKDISTIWIGCDWSDRLNLFPDCYQEFIISFNNLLKTSSPKQIKIEAPLIGFSKENVINFLKYANINLDEIFSGYGNL